MNRSSSREEMATNQQKKHGILQRISNAIISTLENGFYKLGLAIGKRPWVVIGCCILVCGLIGIGFLRFSETTDSSELWIPIGAPILDHIAFINNDYPSTTRVSTIIAISSNVLSKTSLQLQYSLYESAQYLNASNDQQLTDICIKVGQNCRVSSLLELWLYDKTVIDALTDQDIIDTINTATVRVGQNCRVSSLLELWLYDKTVIDALTDQDIIDTINTATVSPVYGSPFDATTLLGKTTTNSTGHITGAQATKISWFLLGDATIIETTKDWELRFVEIGKTGVTGLSTHVFTSRTFSDEGGNAIQGDVALLSAGYFVLIVFVILVLGRFNMVEQRIGLAVSGILCIGLSILVSFGMASIVGAKYGPLHSILPFLLLGIGVDDMFVIVGALNNLTPEERELDIPERVGRVLKHAGVSVTVTSLTDIVAFTIGASTILPALRSFCIFAAFGILGLYVTQTVFFTACLALDLRRQSGMRDACICCYTHKHWHPSACSKVELIPLFFKKVLGPILAKLPVKIVVVIATLGIFGANIYGLIHLKQDFDPSWFLPTDGYGYKYLITQDSYFPSDGANGYVYCPDINYFDNQGKLDELYTTLTGHHLVTNGTLDSWYQAFRTANGGSVTTDEATFIQNVFDWAHLPTNARVLRDMNFENVSGVASNIKSTRIAFVHPEFGEAQAQVASMDSMRELVSGILPQCFPHSRRYQGWETNKVIQLELYRNIGLAFACVFVVTLVLIANFLTSILVFTCVTFTLVNVGGCMYFWGLTIDTVTSIILIIAIGLAVDYSAHIGHQFMTIKGSKRDRMLETLTEMGPPVFNGGFSTFLAFILLVGSNSYVFTTFFKVFLLVVCFGLFHGLIYLPVILSWIGPSPYLTADHEYVPNDNETDPAERMGYTNRAVKIGTPPPEPPVDYDKPSNGVFANGWTSNSPTRSSPSKVAPYTPSPDYTPPLSRTNPRRY